MKFSSLYIETVCQVKMHRVQVGALIWWCATINKCYNITYTYYVPYRMILFCISIGITLDLLFWDRLSQRQLLVIHFNRWLLKPCWLMPIIFMNLLQNIHWEMTTTKKHAHTKTAYSNLPTVWLRRRTQCIYIYTRARLVKAEKKHHRTKTHHLVFSPKRNK